MKESTNMMREITNIQNNYTSRLDKDAIELFKNDTIQKDYILKQWRKFLCNTFTSYAEDLKNYLLAELEKTISDLHNY